MSMDNEKKYELIEQYLSGELSGDVLSSFEKQMAENVELREDVKLQKQLNVTLKGKGVHQLREVLKEVDQNWRSPEIGILKKLRSSTIIRISALAASILLFALAYQLFTAPKNDTNSQLFADNFQPYQMVLSQRNETTDSPRDILLNNSILAYQQKNYQEAVIGFQKLNELDNNNTAYPFYLGLSELALENSDEAIKVLGQVLEKNHHLFMEQSRWYLALAYLQKGEMESAISQLELIPSENYKYTESQKLLKSIK